MAFNTRCPACATVFSVPPSALSASGGWVRCGRCSEVFDASTHQDDGLNTEYNEIADRLARQMQIPMTPEAQADIGLRPRRDGRGQGQTVAAPVPKSVVPPAAPAAVPKASVPQPQPNAYSPQPDVLDKKPARAPKAEGKAAQALMPPERPAPVRKSANADTSKLIEPQPKRANVERRRKGVSGDVPVSGLDRPRATRSRSRAERPSLFDEQASLQSALPLEALNTPSQLPAPPAPSLFAQEHDDDAYSSNSVPPRPTRATWWWSGGLILLLSLSLSMQVIWSQRHELATHYPAMKPALDFMCRYLQCKLMPLRQLDMVSIDNSVFRIVTPSEAGDKYQLSWVVSNQALVAVAAPALELTLQDVLDRPLLRKVIQPADLGTPDLAIAPEGKWQASITVTVLPPEGGVKVSGYRLIAFYP